VRPPAALVLCPRCWFRAFSLRDGVDAADDCHAGAPQPAQLPGRRWRQPLFAKGPVTLKARRAAVPVVCSPRSASADSRHHACRRDALPRGGRRRGHGAQQGRLRVVSLAAGGRAPHARALPALLDD
jgi:hypothetical protein